jgi:hypothetical protein
MTRLKKILIVLTLFVIVLIGGGLFLLYSFLNALSPPEVEINSKFITISSNFSNGFSIEEIAVDSFGQKGIPVKYTVKFRTHCSIDHPIGRPPDPPNKIYYYQEGKYWWTQEHVNITFIHKGLSREPLDTNNNLGWYIGRDRNSTCPLVFNHEQWYFFTFYDRRISGIFFYIDREGKEHQYYLASGISPI